MNTVVEQKSISEKREEKSAKKNYVSQPNMKQEKCPKAIVAQESEMKANWLDEHSTNDFLW